MQSASVACCPAALAALYLHEPVGQLASQAPPAALGAGDAVGDGAGFGVGFCVAGVGAGVGGTGVGGAGVGGAGVGGVGVGGVGVGAGVAGVGAGGTGASQPGAVECVSQQLAIVSNLHLCHLEFWQAHCHATPRVQTLAEALLDHDSA